MKKVGIITLYYHNYNYGGILQAFALPKVVEHISGQVAEQICVDTSLTYTSKERAVAALELLKDGQLLLLSKKVAGSVRQRCHVSDDSQRMQRYPAIKRQRERFDQFAQTVPHSEQVYNIHSDMSVCLDTYDVLLCGSDQIWTEGFTKELLGIMTLAFAGPQQKTIAYAASIGNVRYVDKTKARCVVSGVQNLNAVSVREKSASRYLESLTHRNIPVVLDPTLLLPVPEWNKVAVAPAISKPFIFAYFLGGNRPDDTLRKISQSLKLPIALIPHYRSALDQRDQQLADIPTENVGPAEFLGLVRETEFVLTDSFHALAFSVIYEKQFVAFQRDSDKDKHSMDPRLYDFLESLGLKNRIARTEDEALYLSNQKIDWKPVRVRLNAMRIESLDYLRKALLRM